MEKGNIEKTLNGISKKSSIFIDNSFGFLDKMVSRISKFDDSSNLRTRILSSIVMLVFAVLAICFFKGLFFLLVVAITILMTFEWLELTKSAKDKQKWNLIGFFYILLPMFAVLKLREGNPNVLLWMFGIICATDIFAYFAGKNFGGPKLIPNISPNKTWSGLAGGVLASIIIGFLSSFMFSGSILFFVAISAFLSIVEQISDILESKLKRTFGVKDSGNIIPGHGGVLDRFDGMMLVAPLVLMLIFFFSDNFISK